MGIESAPGQWGGLGRRANREVGSHIVVSWDGNSVCVCATAGQSDPSLETPKGESWGLG